MTHLRFPHRRTIQHHLRQLTVAALLAMTGWGSVAHANTETAPDADVETGNPTARKRMGGPERDAGKRGMAATMKRAKRDFEHIDSDNDNRLTPTEWTRRGNFEVLDKDADGFLTFEEMSSMYRPKPRLGRINTPLLPTDPPEIDPSHATDRVSVSRLTGINLCGIDRDQCKSGYAAAERLGLLPTGLGPKFPAGTECFGIDDYYALDYSYKRSNAVAHGGLDIPAPWDTPILAVAAGTVVGRYLGADTQRGVEVVLRHSPQDTGLPFWTYTQYAHLAALPQQVVGQRVQMGEVIGLTSNTGLDSSNGTNDHRRAALHFVAWFSPHREFADTGSAIVPVQGQWMDPHTLYRSKPPFESEKTAQLPDEEKWVAIPVMFNNGKTEPADTRLIWPYTCLQRR